MSTFGERLEFALKYRNMRKSTLALRLGIDRSYITNYIKGKYSARPDTIQKMAKILRVSPAWLSGYDVPMEPNDASNGTAHSVPILGYVAAGIPIEAITDIIDYEEIPAHMAKDGSEYFGLQIKGDSMEPKISNGDYVIVRKQDDCDSGQIAIVCINGNEATCKKIMKQENGILLVPFNPSYETVFYSNKEIDEIPITIFGIVAEQRRKYIKL